MRSKGEVLRKAAKIMMERGLARNAFMDSMGRVCMAGAIRGATPELEDYDLRFKALEHFSMYLSKLYPMSEACDRIPTVNDSFKKTRTEVDAACMLLEAAKYKAEV